MPVSTREGNCLHKHFTARYRSVHSFLQDSPAFDMDYVSESVFEAIFAEVLEERFPGMSHRKSKDVFAILPTGHGAHRFCRFQFYSSNGFRKAFLHFSRNNVNSFPCFSTLENLRT